MSLYTASNSGRAAARFARTTVTPFSLIVMSSFHIETNYDTPPDRVPGRAGRERSHVPALTLLPTLGDGEHDRHDRHCGHKHIEHESDDGSLSNSKVVL